MAQSKFGPALAALKDAPEPEAAELAAPAAIPAARPVRVREPARGPGRPPGKRSDPDFKPTTLFLRMQTKRAATRLLEDKGAGQDLSELVEELLAKWLKRNT